MSVFQCPCISAIEVLLLSLDPNSALLFKSGINKLVTKELTQLLSFPSLLVLQTLFKTLCSFLDLPTPHTEGGQSD